MTIQIGTAVVLLSAVTAVIQACEVDGKKRANGETWVKNNFEMGCVMPGDGSWHTTINACLAPGGFRIPVGSEVVESGMKYTCKKQPNGSVQFASGPA